MRFLFLHLRLKMKLVLTIFLLAISSSCSNYISSQTKLTSSKSAVASAPEGWMLYPTPSSDSPDLRCANYSKRAWKVIQDGENIKTRLDTLQDHQAPLPSLINSRSVAVGSKGQRYVQQVNDGWLVGLDVGEFGGGLWWFGSDDESSKKLAEDNITGFAKTSVGVVALAGLAHMGTDYGKLLQIGEGVAGNRKVETLADIGTAPRAFVAESPDSLLVLTSHGLVRVRNNGKVEHLFSPEYKLLYPTSMALSPSGVIHVGMRHFIARLTPVGESYKEEWFVPNDCTQFRISAYDCVCSSSQQ